MLKELLYKNKFRIILVILALAAVFLLTYYPSFETPFPKHFNEWRHINEAINLEQGAYEWQTLPAFGLGFHIFLYGINQVADLFQIYKFLAPAWAVLTALVLFFVTYSLSGRNFLTAFSAVLFFSSIKSNINLLGLYFFTPLSFAFPFIFLFIFFFVRGLEKENKKYLFLSFLLMLFLVPVHVTSVTFAFPVLLFSGVLHWKYIKKEIKFFLVFLLIPLVGLFFHNFVTNSVIAESLEILIKGLQFEKGWSRAWEYKDSLTTTYSIAGGILAIIGSLAVLLSRKKELYPYIFWPIWLLLMILIFRQTNISYLSPYHRNFYYFTIGLPFLSAYGLSWMINLIASHIKRINFNFIAVSVSVVVMFFAFISYCEEEDVLRPAYSKTIADNNDYQTLIFLAQLPESKILVHSDFLVPAGPVTGHEIIGEFFDDMFTFEHISKFFYGDDCNFKNAFIDLYNIDYIVSRRSISCDYKLLSSEHGNNYIYKVNVK